MADRYWVGGTGTWNSSNTANWSATSGGASGASVLTSADNVLFNDNSTDTGNDFQWYFDNFNKPTSNLFFGSHV